MKEFTLTKSAFDLWMEVSGADYTGVFCPGILLDNFIVATKAGYVAVYEKYQNEWSSIYRLVFVPYEDLKGVDRLFADFITFRIEVEKYLEGDSDE